MNNDNSFRIFIATDNVSIEEQFLKEDMNVIRFLKFMPKVSDGIGIHHWSKQNNRHELAERVLSESIMDIWILSRCKYLLYMGNSSFSRIAVTLHNSTCINWNY